MKRNPVLRAQLFTRYGFPCSALANALDYFGAANLEELEKRIDAEEIDAFSLSRLRGCGTKQSPGILMQYLFGAPSGTQLKTERIAAKWACGAGI